MHKEIERKFRITKINKKLLKKGAKISQGYLCMAPEVRIRIEDRSGFLTIKSKGGIVRREYEYRIPLRDARALYGMCQWRLQKTRYKLDVMHVDIFSGKLKGLILAEVELKKKNQKVKLPQDLEYYEVTGRELYKNCRLATLPQKPPIRKTSRQ